MLATGLTLAEAEAEAKPDDENEASVVPEAESSASEPVEEVPAAPTKKRGKRRRRRRIRELPNPGKLEECQKEAKDCLQAEAFGGAKVDLSFTPVQKMPLKVMGFQIGTHMDPTMFRDGAEVTYLVNVQRGKTTMVGRLDNKFNLFGRAATNITDNCQYVHTIQVGPEDTYLQCDVHYDGKDYTSGAKYVKQPGSKHVTGVNYFQSVTPNAALGIELVHTVGSSTAMVFSGRYAHLFNKKKEGDVYTLSVDSRGAATGNYTRKLNDNVSLCSELTLTNPVRGANTMGFNHMLNGDATAQIGARYSYNGFRYQGSLKTTGDVVSCLDVAMAPILLLRFSGTLNHFTNDSKFGIGLSMGG
jgi:hypothetical protein